MTQAFCAYLAVAALYSGLRSFASAALPGLLAGAFLAVIVLVTTGFGRFALRIFGARDLSESEKTLAGATLGLGLLSSGLFLLGIAGCLRVWAVSLLLGVFWAAGYWELRGVFRSLNSNFNLLRQRPLAAGSVLALLSLLFWMTWIPPHQYDSLVYHLPLAASYARLGRIAPAAIPLFTHFPQNAELLYALGLLFDSDLLAQMFPWLATALSVCWIFEMGKREIPASTALLACLFTLTHTAVMLLSSTTYVECLVMLWVTASVLSFLRWRGHPAAASWLALSGIFAGLGVGTKYLAGITPAILALYLGVRALRTKTHWKDFAVFTLSACAAGAPWLLKNAWYVGNPVFPFLYNLLPSAGGNSDARHYFGVLNEYTAHHGNPLLSLLKFPFLAFSGSTLYGGGADVLGNLGWGLIITIFPASLWAAGKNRYLRWLTAYSMAHWALWYATGTVLRFLVVIVPLASLSTAYAAHKLWESSGKGGRGILVAGIGGFLLVNFGLFLFVHSTVDDLRVLVGLEDRREFLSRLLDYYPCADYASRNASPEDPVLVVGDQRGYYVDQPHTITTALAVNDFVRMANESAGAPELARRLKEEGGFRHLLVVPREMRRLAGYGTLNFTEEGSARFRALEDGPLTKKFEVPGRCAIFDIN